MTLEQKKQPPTIEELREKDSQAKKAVEKENARLKEKVLCCEVTLPRKDQRHLGVTGFTMKASELTDFVEQEIASRDYNTMTLSIRFMMKTNRWIENLPEADI